MWGTALLVAKAPPEIPRLDEVQVDGWVLLFTLAASVLTGIIFEAPGARISRASRVDFKRRLKKEAKAPKGGRAAGCVTCW